MLLNGVLSAATVKGRGRPLRVPGLGHTLVAFRRVLWLHMHARGTGSYRKGRHFTDPFEDPTEQKLAVTISRAHGIATGSESSSNVDEVLTLNSSCAEFVPDAGVWHKLGTAQHVPRQRQTQCTGSSGHSVGRSVSITPPQQAATCFHRLSRGGAGMYPSDWPARDSLGAPTPLLGTPLPRRPNNSDPDIWQRRHTE